MSSSKPKRMIVPWVIKPKNLFLIHQGEQEAGLQPGGDLLAECTAAGRLVGHFWWAMKGGNADAGFRLRHIRVFENAPAFYLDLNMKPDEIAIRPNTCSGKWTDLIDWITEEKLTVTCDDDSTSSNLLGKKPINFVVQSYFIPYVSHLSHHGKRYAYSIRKQSLKPNLNGTEGKF